MRTFVISSPVTVDRLASFLKANLEHPLMVKVERHKRRRSNTANARLWALHTLAADVTGYSAEEMHDLALCRYFGSEEIKAGGLALAELERALAAERLNIVKEFNDRAVEEFGDDGAEVVEAGEGEAHDRSSSRRSRIAA